MSLCKLCKCPGCAVRGSEFDFATCPSYEPMNNGDRIRTKSDEELAAWFRIVADCEGCPATENFDECRHGKDCEDKWLEWLRVEATS